MNYQLLSILILHEKSFYAKDLLFLRWIHFQPPFQIITICYYLPPFKQANIGRYIVESLSPDYFLLSFSLFTKHFAASPNDNKFVSFHGSLPTLSPFLNESPRFSVVCETLCKKEACNIMCRILCIHTTWYFNSTAFWHKKLYNCCNKNMFHSFSPCVVKNIICEK